jgi:hypothetical protein
VKKEEEVERVLTRPDSGFREVPTIVLDGDTLAMKSRNDASSSP